MEEERRKISVERQAFQVEQMLILEWIEKKKDELEVMRSDLLAKEHDVIVRVLNEKALIEEERHEFERRKSADVIRIREEVTGRFLNKK